MKNFLLKHDSLDRVRLAISVSGSTDLSRLGLMESHFKLTLGEVVRSVLVAGGGVSYGGHLSADGYTSFMANELHRFGRRTRPFHVVLAHHEHAKKTEGELRGQIETLGLYGQIIALSADGKQVDPFFQRSSDPATVDGLQQEQSLTSMRRFLTENSSAKLLMGGKRKDFQGAMPGLLEEAILAVEAAQPVYFAGGFGGITSDLMRALEIDGGEWLPQYPKLNTSELHVVPNLEKLKEAWLKNGMACCNNGLTEEERLVLAISHRPSEIATLVSLGLGRRFDVSTL